MRRVSFGRAVAQTALGVLIGRGEVSANFMGTIAVVTCVFTLLATEARPVVSQAVPRPTDTRSSLLEESNDAVRKAMQGLLSDRASVPDTGAGHRCVPLPFDPPDDRLEGPHGDSLLTARCEVLSYQSLGRAPGGPWFAAQYRWTSVFSADPHWPRETPRTGALARDTATEGEAVLFAAAGPGQVRPVWHQRFEYRIWRSVTPEVAAAPGASTLLSVQRCVNGTGGCTQEFLRRSRDGRWAPVREVWLAQLPRGFADRILHGFRIDPRTLQGDAGFYGPNDGNCCPSETLRLWLGLNGDSLVLLRQTVAPTSRR